MSAFPPIRKRLRTASKLSLIGTKRTYVSGCRQSRPRFRIARIDLCSLTHVLTVHAASTTVEGVPYAHRPQHLDIYLKIEINTA